jgi:hypothetical protein
MNPHDWIFCDKINLPLDIKRFIRSYLTITGVKLALRRLDRAGLCYKYKNNSVQITTHQTITPMSFYVCRKKDNPQYLDRQLIYYGKMTDGSPFYSRPLWHYFMHIDSVCITFRCRYRNEKNETVEDFLCLT